MVKLISQPTVRHEALDTTFIGVEHLLSSDAAPIHHFRGIKYATIPARWRQSKLCTSYAPGTDATKYGPICPQTPYNQPIEGLAQVPQPVSDEFHCLNLNITCPGNLIPTSRVPVMVWVHGGGKQGAGSSWIYDAGALVQRSMITDKPVIVITFNFRLGILGTAASPLLLEDNTEAGDQGVGNYGLRDQAQCLKWVSQFILEFGGDPANITVFGESTGASDILCHMRSAENLAHPLFQRAICQSPIGSIEYDSLDVGVAGFHLSKLMPLVHAATLDELRAVDVTKLVTISGYQNPRATDDGVFFQKGWKDAVVAMDHHQSSRHLHKRHSGEVQHAHHHDPHAHHFHHSRPHTPSFGGIHPLPSHAPHPPPAGHPAHQPLIIGDCSSSTLLYSVPAALWDATSTVRRIKAVCQSNRAAATIMRVYDISEHTEEEDLPERVVELLGDARFAWPVERAAASLGGRVYRYVFDEELPPRAHGAGVPRYAPDLAYLFDPAPHPDSPPASPPPSAVSGARPLRDYYPDLPDEDDEGEDDFDDAGWREYDTADSVGSVDWGFVKVRDALQDRWVAFAHGETPWREDRVYVFGPDGETGERSGNIVDTRRRRRAWKEAFEPLGLKAVQKLGIELSSGPLMAMS